MAILKYLLLPLLMQPTYHQKYFHDFDFRAKRNPENLDLFNDGLFICETTRVEEGKRKTVNGRKLLISQLSGDILLLCLPLST